MKIDNLRYTLTDNKVSHSLFSSYVNEMLLVYPSIDESILEKIEKDAKVIKNLMEEETENMLRRIGINFTHFRDFLAGKQIGNDETIRYRTLINFIDSEENKKEGEKLILQIKALKR